MAPVRILVVCTANVCRSPYAAAVLQAVWASRTSDVVVRSAGTIDVNLPTDPRVVRLLEESGISRIEHQPRRISRDILNNDGRSLIITMTRAQLHQVLGVDGTTLPRVFTFRDLVQRCESAPPLAPLAPVDSQEDHLARWIRHIQSTRVPTELLGLPTDDDIADPYGQSARMFRRVMREIDELSSRFVAAAPA